MNDFQESARFEDELEAIRRTPWKRPASFSREVLATLPEFSSLGAIVALLAGIDVSQSVDGFEILKRGMRLAQAFNSITGAAAAGLVKLRGATSGGHSQDISAAIFNDPMTLVSGDDNAFGPDGNAFDDDNKNFLGDLDYYESLVWRRVTVDRTSLVAWLFPSETTAKSSKAGRFAAWIKQNIQMGRRAVYLGYESFTGERPEKVSAKTQPGRE
jgi:hypothetical protein